MAILKVARIGHPVVRAAARNLASEEIRSAAIQRHTLPSDDED